jgi:hypothetical protein
MPELTMTVWRRFLLGLLAAIALLVTALALLFPAGSSARLTYRACGRIPTGAVWSVSATTNVTCHKARKVVKKAIGGNKHPLGFACQSGRIGTYEYGWFCRRGDHWVKGTTGT